MTEKTKKQDVAHRVLDAVAKIENKQREIAQKHNDMAAQLAAMEGLTKQIAAFTASELGKIGGTLQRQIRSIGEATNAIDVNVLALAEVLKEIISYITQIDYSLSAFRVTGNNSDIEINSAMFAVIKETASNRYKELVAASFKVVQDRLDQEDKERQAKEIAEAQLAKEAAEKASAIEESKRIETELQRAHLAERAIVPSVSGGAGSPFPQGAQIFGE